MKFFNRKKKEQKEESKVVEIINTPKVIVSPNISNDENNVDVIIDNIFNKDLNIGGVIINNFTIETEFEFQGLFRKISKLAGESDKINSDFVFDKIPFELVSKVAEWLDKNTNINTQLQEGNLIDKCIIFISTYLDYEEFKKKLRK